MRQVALMRPVVSMRRVVWIGAGAIVLAGVGAALAGWLAKPEKFQWGQVTGGALTSVSALVASLLWQRRYERSDER
ncbi:MAG: hypothetical protein JWL58_6388, partial [Streptosporangiaceae bacterium]|nr:hypothetical protein [Streptosporangiaceae bacterium]